MCVSVSVCTRVYRPACEFNSAASCIMLYRVRYIIHAPASSICDMTLYNYAVGLQVLHVYQLLKLNRSVPTLCTTLSQQRVNILSSLISSDLNKNFRPLPFCIIIIY